MDREGIAWIAGFFEGDGTVGVKRRKARDDPLGRKAPEGMTITAEIWQAGVPEAGTPEPLIRVMNILNLGKVYGPYANGGQFLQPKNGFKPKWCWTAQGFHNTQAFVAMVWPWLSPRRQSQARTALESFAEYKVRHPGGRKTSKRRP